MAAYQKGELAAFSELVARHEKPLWRFLRCFVRDAAAAEDLLQEAFMRVVKGASTWRPDAKFSTWLYTIARNLCIDYTRSAAHRRALSLDVVPRAGELGPAASLHEQLPDRGLGGEERALNRELAARLEGAIAALPELQREVFVMRELLDLPFAEIAIAVGATPATVKSRMRYALERLRVDLAGLYREGAAPEVLP